jgi:hypothetical protein
MNSQCAYTKDELVNALVRKRTLELKKLKKDQLCNQVMNMSKSPSQHTMATDTYGNEWILEYVQKAAVDVGHPIETKSYAKEIAQQVIIDLNLFGLRGNIRAKKIKEAVESGDFDRVVQNLVKPEPLSKQDKVFVKGFVKRLKRYVIEKMHHKGTYTKEHVATLKTFLKDKWFMYTMIYYYNKEKIDIIRRDSRYKATHVAFHDFIKSIGIREKYAMDDIVSEYIRDME